MRVGLVGKPNVGKSTAFSSLTSTLVEIADYPFTTIEPNIGIAWIPVPIHAGVLTCSQRPQKAKIHRLTVEVVYAIQGQVHAKIFDV